MLLTLQSVQVGFNIADVTIHLLMEIQLLTIGRTASSYVAAGIDDYCGRLRRYVPFSIITIPDIKKSRSLTEARQKEEEGKALLSKVTSADLLILLDERGEQNTSIGFSEWLQRRMASGRKRIIFAIGGPYGFSEEVYSRADAMVSLSRMTFNHEMVRLFFTEQVYRAMTILRGEPYHHE